MLNCGPIRYKNKLEAEKKNMKGFFCGFVQRKRKTLSMLINCSCCKCLCIYRIKRPGCQAAEALCGLQASVMLTLGSSAEIQEKHLEGFSVGRGGDPGHCCCLSPTNAHCGCCHHNHDTFQRQRPSSSEGLTEGVVVVLASTWSIPPSGLSPDVLLLLH